MTKKDEMVKIWFDDMEEMFQIKLSEWEKLKDNALPPYNNYSEHHYASGSNDFDWFENSNIELKYGEMDTARRYSDDGLNVRNTTQVVSVS